MKVARFELQIEGQGADGEPLTPQAIAVALQDVAADVARRYAGGTHTSSIILSPERTVIGRWSYQAPVEVPE